MFGLFQSKTKEEYAYTWSPIMDQAKTSLPSTIPKLPRQQAKNFIQDWNARYEAASEEEKIGLAVLAYRVDVHRYAAGMLIEGKKATRLSGIRILGYMRDESAWSLLKDRLLQHPDSDLSLAALNSLFQINERRARDELRPLIRNRPDWPSEKVSGILSSFYPDDEISI